MIVMVEDFVSKFLNDVVSCQEFDNVDAKIRQQIHHLLVVIGLLTRNPEKCQFIIDEQAKVKVNLLCDFGLWTQACHFFKIILLE